MISGLLIFLLLSLNIGGLFTLVTQLGHGHTLAALHTLLMVVGLNVLGFWVLREMKN